MVVALPLVAAYLAQKGMQLIDTIMMGWLGPSALAAGALSTYIFFSAIVFCMGTLSSVGVFIGHARGENNMQDVKLILQHGIIIAFLLSAPSMLIMWFAPYILIAIGENPLVVTNTILFLHGLVWGFPGLLLFLVFREFISAFALSKIVMIVTTASIPLTFIANYVLMYGKYGLPVLGIAGIGYAGAIIMWFMFFCLWLYSRRHKLLREHTASVASLNINHAKLKKMLAVGIPSGIIYTLDSAMFLSAALMMGYFGVTALAAHQIAMQCAILAYAIPFSLSMATALQVGHAAGTKDYFQVKQIAYISFTIGLFASATIALIFLLFPTTLAKLFLNSDESNYKQIIHMAASFLSIAAIFQCLDAIQTVANGVLRGLKDTFVPMILSIGCYWLFGVGGACYLAFYTPLGAAGIWYGLTLGIGSSGILLGMRFLQRCMRLTTHHVVRDTACGVNLK